MLSCAAGCQQPLRTEEDAALAHLEGHRRRHMIVIQLMKKTMLVVLPALALSFAAPMAHADEGPRLKGPINAANNHGHATLPGPVPNLHEVAALPVGPYVGTANIAKGNVLPSGH